MHNGWKPALAAAGVERNRDNGFHALRHHYASVLLEDRARGAIDAAHAPAEPVRNAKGFEA